MKLIADTHTHTIASNHAYSTVLENIEAAKERGLLYLAMTEHGPNMPDAPHIWHCLNQWEVPSVYRGVHILHGVEANILDADGSLDIDSRVLRSLEWVIASMHGPCFAPQSREQHTKAWLNIAQNPDVDVIGHCGRGNFEFDYLPVLKAFKEYGKIVEVNNATLCGPESARSRCAQILKLCKQLEIPVVVNSDAHFAGNVGGFAQAIQLLEELEFPQQQIINADAERFEQVVAQKRTGGER